MSSEAEEMERELVALAHELADLDLRSIGGAGPRPVNLRGEHLRPASAWAGASLNVP